MERKRRLSAVVKLQYEYQSLVLVLETAASSTIMSSVLDNRCSIFGEDWVTLSLAQEKNVAKKNIFTASIVVAQSFVVQILGE